MVTLLGSTWGGVSPPEQQANTKTGVEITGTVFEDPTQVFNYSLGEFFLKSRLTKLIWISCFSLHPRYYQENYINISSLNIQGGLWFGKRDMKLGPSTYAKTQQLSWGSDRRVIPRLLQITQDRSFSLFCVHIALCRVSSSRLQNNWWSSWSIRLNWNSTSSQPSVFVPSHH